MSFNYKKAAQALNYFATRNGGAISKLRALKLIYFADRYHLRKYGRLLTGDQYYAMKFGPVASGVKDIAEMDSVSGQERHYARQFLERGAQDHDVKSKAPVAETVFSPSDRESLAFAWDQFGQTRGIVNVTHRFPEWTRHESRLLSVSRIPMNIEDFLLDPPPGTNPCHPLSDDDRVLRLDEIRERAYCEELLSPRAA